MIRRLYRWIRRIAYCRGFGIQSPNDFAFVNDVIYETLPYYCYEVLHGRAYPDGPHYREKVNRLLFRIVNWAHPKYVVEEGGGDGSCTDYIRAACSCHKSFSEEGKTDFIHIGHTSDNEEAYKRLHRLAHGGTILVIGHIHDSKANELCWKRIEKSKHTGVTFDLYDVGIVFFDKKRYKKNYKINFF
ncbi:MAG: hypothetical protein Q4E55_04155 [Bacteroidales bacterium]|nr:hypothetical protein [Bacteroidales bacterium]